jgi:hypothetical protein
MRVDSQSQGPGVLSVPTPVLFENGTCIEIGMEIQGVEQVTFGRGIFALEARSATIEGDRLVKLPLIPNQIAQVGVDLRIVGSLIQELPVDSLRFLKPAGLIVPKSNSNLRFNCWRRHCFTLMFWQEIKLLVGENFRYKITQPLSLRRWQG